MKPTTKTIRTVTLGDLVAAAFDRAERTGELPVVVREVAARDLEARLRRSNRVDLIRTLASAERELRTPASLIGGGNPRASAARVRKQDGRAAIAAAG